MKRQMAKQGESLIKRSMNYKQDLVMSLILLTGHRCHSVFFKVYERGCFCEIRNKRISLPWGLEYGERPQPYELFHILDKLEIVKSFYIIIHIFWPI